jgi:hypothetical protein
MKMIPVLLVAFGVTAAVLQSPLLSAQKELYARLFRLQALLGAAQPGAQQQPRVVCGMMMVPTDPNFDARIRIIAPTTPDHKIRAIQPPACVD